MTAILKEDPPDPSTSGIVVAPAVQRIVRRCLEKRPEERFQSTRDLAFALESSLDASSAAGTTAAGVTPTGRWVRNFRWVGAGLLVGAVLGSGGVMMWRAPSTASITLPSFRQLTFDRGTIRDARFTPDGQSVVYSAAWGGNPIRISMTRTDAAESVRLSLPDARLLSISPTGQMAISLGHTYEGWMGMGTLAQSSVLGSTPRGLAEHVREADWAPNGTDLAVVRRAGALEQLEFPLGHVIYRTSGFISHVRVSPSGDQVAFADHPIFADDAGGVSVVDRNGRRVELARGYQSVRGVAWAPDGHEVWFSGVKGEPRGSAGYGLYAATLDGRQRIVWSSPSFATCSISAARDACSSGTRRPSVVSRRCSRARTRPSTYRCARRRPASGLPLMAARLRSRINSCRSTRRTCSRQMARRRCSARDRVSESPRTAGRSRRCPSKARRC
jgi:hypothetical protein